MAGKCDSYAGVHTVLQAPHIGPMPKEAGLKAGVRYLRITSSASPGIPIVRRSTRTYDEEEADLPRIASVICVGTKAMEMSQYVCVMHGAV
jgi:hypothetical protein